MKKKKPENMTAKEIDAELKRLRSRMSKMDARIRNMENAIATRTQWD